MIKRKKGWSVIHYTYIIHIFAFVKEKTLEKMACINSAFETTFLTC